MRTAITHKKYENHIEHACMKKLMTAIKVIGFGVVLSLAFIRIRYEAKKNLRRKFLF